MFEEQRVQELWNDIEESDRWAETLRYHEPTRSFCPSGSHPDADNVFRVTKVDADLFGFGRAAS